jgi:lipopolysaccharide assembly outer membrane protein LptD (OstA)
VPDTVRFIVTSFIILFLVPKGGAETAFADPATRTKATGPITGKREWVASGIHSSPYAFAAQKASVIHIEDSLQVPDSTEKKKDTVVVFQVKNAVDTIVTYSAKDSVVYDLNEKKMVLFNTANIAYGSTSIKAYQLAISWDQSTIDASGVADTTKGREGKEIGTPVFIEGKEEYRGRKMTYHFKTKKGVITEGETALDEGFYQGERIKRMSEDVYFIWNGKYSTCDNPDHKHFYFGSPKMKFIPRDVIVAEPVVFYVEDIPLFALPFAVIPSKSGRASGILMPTFGEDLRRGRYLRNGGYYFALTDYYDLKLTGDWFSKGGYQLNAAVQYAVRYNLHGSISASFGRQQYNIGDPYSPDDLPSKDYNIGITHNQQIDPTSSLNIDFRFMTNSYYNNFSNNLNQLLNQNAWSSATYSTSWEGTNRSMSVSIMRQQDLRAGTSYTKLPEISFNQSQVFPFRSSESTGSEAWYELIGFNYSGQFQNTLDVRKYQSFTGVDSTKELYIRNGIQHSISLIATPKFGYFTISPNFSANGKWYDHRIRRSYTPGDSLVRWTEERGFYPLHTFSAGVSASTKLYGTIQPGVAGILGIRHTMMPSLSYSYYPDFSRSSYGYYKKYRDSLNNVISYDPYTGYSYLPGEIYGGVSSGESQTMSMSLSNIIEMKINPAKEDTTMTPRKFQLFSFDLSSNYNFVKDSMKLAPVSASFRTNIKNVLDIYGGASFSPYVFVGQRTVTDQYGNQVLLSGHEINAYLVNEGKGLARLTSFDFHLSTTLNQDFFNSQTAARDSTRSLAAELKSGSSPGFKVQWNLSIGYDFSQSQFDPGNKSRSSSLRANLSLNPTPGWRLSASAYYDVVTRELGTPMLTVYRDLHCWEMSFNWVPAGALRNYAFVIRLKAPQLQDIKLEKKGSDRGVYGY